MKGCHSCEHAAAVAAGRYKFFNFKDTPCAGCEVCPDEHVIAYDDNWVSKELYARRDERYERREVPGKPEACFPISVMAEFVRGLLSLPAPMRESVAMRYAGMKYREIGERLGVTTACVESRVSRALRLWPQLQDLFPAKVSKYEKRHRVLFPIARDTKRNRKQARLRGGSPKTKCRTVKRRCGGKKRCDANRQS